ncbi:hypothetical protein N1851_003816 [Merluccius polli]|uniref:Uncharacterized protein n=1 Tax=Merluccius polli TaxID=89951 RepID=A0AA47N940_MERPO|nr:hypothetical protein N1851_003816 [Merluccius polli]
MSFIATLANITVPTVRERSIRDPLNARTPTYNSGLSGNMSEYKVASYGLRRAVKDAKRKYRDRVETQMEQHADDLDSFYTRFGAINNIASLPAKYNIVNASGVSFTAGDEHTLSVTEHNVKRALTSVNTRKAAISDGISEYWPLALVFPTIVNLSLAKSMVPTCFKGSTYDPVPRNASPACLND